MILQVTGRKISTLWIEGKHVLPFMVCRRGPIYWRRYAIVSVHRTFWGRVDSVMMYRLTEQGGHSTLYDVITESKGKVAINNQGYPDPDECKNFDDPIWYRLGPGYRILVIDSTHVDDMM